MRLSRPTGVSALALLLAACGDVPTQTLAPEMAAISFSRAAGNSCVGPATQVVSDEAGLRAALAAAPPGAVVAVEGVIQVADPVFVEIPEGVTLTCAAPGAALVKTTYGHLFLWAGGSNVTISGLVIDGAESEWPVQVQNGFGPTDVSHFTLRQNEIVCGWSGCTFVIGVRNSVISGNRAEARHTAATGIHLQMATAPDGTVYDVDNALVENNVVTALVPAGASLFGAIRPRDGSNVTVRNNTVRGPWSNGMAMAEIHNSLFERNSIDGVQQFGLFLGANPFSPISVTGSLYRANDISSAGGPAVFMQRACGSVLNGNRLSAPAGTPTVAFAASTGANALLGHAAEVENNGSIDCNGDGVVNPNMIAGKTRGGRYVADIIAPVMQTVAGQNSLK